MFEKISRSAWIPARIQCSQKNLDILDIGLTGRGAEGS